MYTKIKTTKPQRVFQTDWMKISSPSQWLSFHSFGKWELTSQLVFQPSTESSRKEDTWNSEAISRQQRGQNDCGRTWIVHIWMAQRLLKEQWVAELRTSSSGVCCTLSLTRHHFSNDQLEFTSGPTCLTRKACFEIEAAAPQLLILLASL